jgi:hypothetical protein
MGIVMEKTALVQVFFEYIGFPCHSFTTSTVPQSPPSIIQG